MLKLVAFAIALTLAPLARADCPTVTSSTPDSTCVRDVMMHGNRGTWFDQINTAEILRVKTMYPELLLQVEKYSLMRASLEKENKHLRDAIQLQKDTTANLQAQLNLANKDAREAKEKLASYPRWYASPVFWGITMFIAGAAIQNVCCSGK